MLSKAFKQERIHDLSTKGLRDLDEALDRLEEMPQANTIRYLVGSARAKFRIIEGYAKEVSNGTD